MTTGAYVKSVAGASRPAVDELLSTERAAPFGYVRRRLLNGLALAASDVAALTLSAYAAAVASAVLGGTMAIPLMGWYLIPVWLVGTIVANLVPSWGLGPVEELRRYTIVLVLSFAAVTTAALLLGSLTPRTLLFLSLMALFGLMAVPLARLRMKRLLIRFDAWGIPIVIYGAGTTGTRIFALLQNEQGLGYNPVGLFCDHPLPATLFGKHVRLLGNTAQATPRAPVALLAAADLGRERTVELLEGPLLIYRAALVVPDLFDAPSLWVRPRDLSGFIGLEIRHNLRSPSARACKRALDLALVIAAMPVWVPVCSLLTLLIWLQDRTSPLFVQERVGIDGKLFRTYKFRTMVPNAEEVLRARLETDATLRHEWESSRKLKRDPRITPVGAILRRLSLDELPQLLNVLRGDMSLVGPRPLPLYHDGDLTSRVRDLRARVRPGITGLWQVSGRSDAGTEGIELWDPYYVKNWSLWLDLIVITRTIRAVVDRTGAY